MATVVQPIIEPNPDGMKVHLEALFAPVRDIYPNGLIELCYGSHSPDRAMFFGVDAASIDRAIEFACGRNREGQNVYVGVNPRKPTTRLGHRAADADVEVAFYQFADLDKAEAVVKARNGLPIRPSMIVMTGTVPNNRPHFYWQLEEPMGNLAAWTEAQRGISHTLEGDAVINPSRIMRLAGTVNYPSQDKMGRGYRMELVTVRTEFSSERPPVPAEMFPHSFPVRREASLAPIPVGTGNTLSDMAKRRTRVADLIHACQSGDNWHNSMVRLVAHLVAVGRTDAEIMGLGAGITLPGYTVDQTHREMLAALKGARTKWAVPEPQDDVEAEESEREDGDSVFTLLDMDELENLPPPTWLIEEMIADHGLSIIYGDPGAGKSFIALDMALRIAYGMDWHGVATKKVGVLYIAGEGARGLGKRVKGWRREHALEGVDAPFRLLPVAVQMLDPKERAKLCRTIDAAKAKAGFDIALVFIDTVSRSLAGQDENSQDSMSLFVAGAGEVQVHTGGAVVAVHHSGKDKDKGMRGSTVLLGGCDASMRVTKSGEIATLKTEKQKDAEEAAPINFTLKKVEWVAGLGKPESTLVPFKSEAPIQSTVSTNGLSRAKCRRLLDEIDAAWTKGKPWSVVPQTRRQGRYLPSWMTTDFDMPEAAAIKILADWQTNDVIEMADYDARSGLRGLRVTNYPEDWK